MKTRAFLVACLAVSLVGCWGGGNFTKLREPGKRSTPAKTYKLESIARKQGIEDSIQTAFVLQLERDFPDLLQERGFVPADSLADLNIKILIEDIRPGNAGLRYMGGIWALMGKGKALVLIKTSDNDGRELFSGEAEGTVTGGKWGGSILDASRRIAKAYTDSLPPPAK